jgi:hypothetical protein
MTISSFFQNNIPYLEDDTGINTRITFFKYQRPKPNSKLLRTPIGAITLPLPDNMPADDYSMQIGPEDLGVAGNITNPTHGESASQLNATIRERMGLSESAAGSIIAGLTGLAASSPLVSDALEGLKGLGGANIGGTARASAGVTRNPHTALLFNNVNLRTFTFNWKLSPRSIEQSIKLNQIINFIKRAMHPSLAVAGFALDYPNLVKVSVNNDKEGVVDVDYAFIQHFQIDPTPHGQTYYRNGYPVFVNMSLTVNEIRIKTAEDFIAGAIAFGGISDRQQYEDASTK